jgi:primosomal protein N' (replication factor Y)
LLTDEQQAAAASISSALESGQNKTFLLYGTNDSGKTEVYLRAIESCLKKGFSAIYLVPDISLISQFRGLLEERFPDVVGVWHSGLTQRQKNGVLLGLKTGKTKIILGTRSAIFLPLNNPRLFVVDEEDDEFYKNIQTPKYHARDVAVKRAAIAGGVAVLGSATPSLETYYKVKTGGIEVLRLTDRIPTSKRPKITLVDLRYAGRFIISRPLKYAISCAIEQKKQVFILVNRRGWATYIRCNDCGELLRCGKCAVPLVYHKNPQGVMCHYCGYKGPLPARCSKCGGRLALSGYGTERVEDLVKKLFPGVDVIRADADSGLSYNRLYGIMKSGRPCILVGTQIVAKGFDFPDLTTVGIVNAGSGLYSPDFCSSERTFSLLTHTIGRSGRGSSAGQVIIQSDNPEHYAIKYATEFDYEKFYEHEVSFRSEFRWPPVVRVIGVSISGAREKDVTAYADKIAGTLEGIEGLDLLGPVPKIMPYLAGKYRWHIILKFEESESIRIKSEAAKAAARAGRKAGVSVVFDVDPVETA